MRQSLLAVVTMLGLFACKADAVYEADFRTSRSESASGDVDATAMAWWVWAARELRSPPDSVADAGLSETWIGPSAAQIQPPGDPVDVRASGFPEGTKREELEDQCRELWLLRQMLPPVRDETAFFDRLHRLDSTLAHMNKGRGEFKSAVDLGFGIQSESAYVAGARLDLLSYQGQLFRVVVGAGAAPGTAPIVSAALGEAFSPVPVTDPRRGSSWQVDYRQPGAWHAARRALDDALGAGPEVVVPPELARAYERLTSPFEPFLIVWKGSEGRGYEELEALRKARRYDLLRSVLRGLNPVGRAYAALALKEANQITLADRKAIHVLGKSPLYIPIEVEQHDDQGGGETSARFFSTLRWPTKLDVGR